MIHCCRLCGVAEKESFWEVLLRKDAGGVSVVTRVSEAFSGFFFLSFVSGVGFLDSNQLLYPCHFLYPPTLEGRSGGRETLPGA